MEATDVQDKNSLGGSGAVKREEGISACRSADVPVAGESL